MVRSIGQLSAQSNVSGSSVSGSATPDSSCSVKSVLRQLNGKSYPSLGKHEKLSIDRKFVKALHETATAFAMFDHPSWQEFFAEGMPTWCTPSPLAISTHLLSDLYDTVQNNMAKELLAAPGVVLSMDGATNVLSRSMSNVIAHSPAPWFVEYLRADLKKETSRNTLDKVIDVLNRLHEFIGKDVVHAFISDSCNSMRLLRELIVSNKVLDYAYGCGAHALNNYCEEIVLITPVKNALKRALFVSKSVKNQGMLAKIFAMICIETVGKALAMVLYSASRWSSVNYMFLRLMRVKPVLVRLPSIVAHESDAREIDPLYELPRELTNIINDKSFWVDVARCVTIFDPICKCIGVMECDTATMSTTYAAFLYVYIQVRAETSDSNAVMLERLCYQWDRIYSPVHALAFFCDPFFYPLRTGFVDTYGSAALGLGKGDLNAQCVAAIKLITRCRSSEVCDAVMGDFLNLCVDMATFVDQASSIINYHSRLIWGQCGGKYKYLTAELLKIYTGPASTAGVERQHKVGKRVHTARRNRAGGGKVEQQVAVAHNSATARRKLTHTRHAFEHILAQACSNLAARLPDEMTIAQQAIDAQDGGDPEAANDPIECFLSEEELGEQDDLARRLAEVDSVAAIDEAIMRGVSAAEH